MSASTSESLPTSSSSYDPFLGEGDIARSWRRGLEPDPQLTVSEWADKYRILSSQSAAEPGRYRTDRAPFNRGVMDALSPSSPYTRIVFMKATQVGASEDGNNWIGFVIHHVPAPFLAVQPTTELAKRFSQQRIDPLIEATPELREIVKPARKRDSGNTVFVKRFAGGVLILTGANSAVGLRSMPARFLFLDEVDAYPPDVDDEGDPIKLAERRAQTFGHRKKVFIVSTPTIKGVSRIEMEYEATDQRRWFVPCPHCQAMQWLKFERLRWNKGDPTSAVYVCEHCEKEIEEHHKTWMLEKGEWRATAPCADPKTIGFHISALYSPVGWTSWGEIAKEWEEASGNEALVKTFKNTLLGESFQEKGEAPDWKRLYDRKRESVLQVVPNEALILTAGVDVQRDRIEIDVYAWGYGVESWLIDHIVEEGDTAHQAVWDKLAARLGQTYLRQNGQMVMVSRWAVDTGDGATTSQAYAFVRQHAGICVAIKGVDGFNRASPVEGPSYIEITERGRKIKKGVKLWKISVAVFKSETYRFLRLDRPTDEDIGDGIAYPDGYIHIPDGVDSEWFKQLTAEQLVIVKSKKKKSFPRQEWQKLRERNEALDNRVYARAAAWMLGIDRWPLKKGAPPTPAPAAAENSNAPESAVSSKPSPVAPAPGAPSGPQETPEQIKAAIRARMARRSGGGIKKD